MDDRKHVCASHIYRRSNGIAGLPKSTKIKEPCGRPAVLIFRGIRPRPDGSVFLYPWETRCKHCSSPGWEEEMRASYPGIGDREIVRQLHG